MAFDGIVTRAVVCGLQDLVGGRITKIYQPTPTDLVMHIRSGRTRGKLLISINAAAARIHMTEQALDNPDEPPMFCMLLRKHLEGSVIEAVGQIDFERIVYLDLRSRNELGDLTEKRVMIELMGRHSNVVLLDRGSGRIIDSMKHLTSAVNRYRTVLPGETYVMPPDQGKMNPLRMTAADLTARIDWNAGRIDRQIVGAVKGFSPVIAGEIVHRAGLPTPAAIAGAFEQVQEQIRNDDYKPNIVYDQHGKDDYHVIELTDRPGNRQTFADVHRMLDQFYAVRAERDAVKQKSGDLRHFVALESKKYKTKLKKLEKTLNEAKDADRFRLFGELLTANMHRIKRGDRTVEVVNYYDPEQKTVPIPLNPNRTPSENAQSYFKKYNKAKTARRVVREQIEATKREIAYFDSLSQQVDAASLKDIEEIREELVAGGYLKNKKTGRKKKKRTHPEVDHYFASDGTPILAGKNNRQNDYLTMKVAGREEIWMHAKDIPGSHVVVRSERPDRQTLAEAATIAAFFSKSRFGSRVPVDYTKVKHVKKPNGAKPGFVIYTDQKTVFVTPSESLVLKLKKKPDVIKS